MIDVFLLCAKFFLMDTSSTYQYVTKIFPNIAASKNGYQARHTHSIETKIMIGQDIHPAIEILKQGDVVAIPTETVYGLAANAFNKHAVARVFAIKKRPSFNPLIVHIAQIEYLSHIASTVDARLMHLMKKYAPGPLTILVPKKDIVPDIVTAGHSQVAVRIPKHPITLKLLQQIDFPLAAPSANPFQYISPTTAQQVEEQLGTQVPYILDGGKCRVGIESTIVGIENDTVTIYRLGGLPIEDIEKEIGRVKIKTFASPDNVLTSGQLKKHYAPKKKMIIGSVEQLLPQYTDKRVAIIIYGKKEIPVSDTHIIYNLSPDANLTEAAANLFDTLYQIDHQDVDIIIAELVSNEGIGRAINDRLIRAANYDEKE